MHRRTTAALSLALLAACGGSGFVADDNAAPTPPIGALSTPIWYVVADAGGGNGGNDWLGSVDITLAPPANNHQTIGTGTGTNLVEAAAFWPGTDTLYAFNAARLGTIDLATGAFAPVGPSNVYADGNPANLQGLNAARLPESIAPSSLNDIDGMTFDPNTGVAYGVARMSGADALFVFDVANGLIVRNAFTVGGTSYDYFRLASVTIGNLDVDDITIDPNDGQMYCVANNAGSSDHIVRIDKFDGTTSDVGLVGVNDMEGLSVYNDGTMWGTTGGSSPVPANRNAVWSIDPVTGAASNRRPLTAGGSDFESLAFLTGDLNQYCGRVWCDDNGNGTQDIGESGAPNVTLVLWRDANDNDVLDIDTDVVLTTTTSDVQGDYCFGVASTGEYLVSVLSSTLPADTVLTGASALPISAPNVGQTVTGLDFVKIPTSGAIGDMVFFDANSNGIQDPTEPGLRGVTLELIDAGADGVCGTTDDALITTTTTDVGGYYLFPNNADGVYCVDVTESTLPPDHTLTTANEPYTATINGGNNDLAADFGYLLRARVGDFVWIDTNADGLQDANEPPLRGVDITLTTPGPDGAYGTADDVTVATATTDADGRYVFASLPAGSYRVSVDDSDAPVGSTRTTPAEYRILLRPGQAFLDADFGYTGGSAIGDLVWGDADGDQTLNGGEAGIGGVVLQLTESGSDGIHGTTDDLDFGTQTTAADGSYLFDGLPAGDYRVSLDEDTLPATIRTRTTPSNPIDVSLDGTNDDLTADFGYQLNSGTIGDLVWNDVNGDGVRDAGEPGVGNVTVNLTEAGPDGVLGTGDDVSLPAQTTDSSGAYDFTTLAPGLYRVDVDETSLPAGMSLTTANEPHDVTLGAQQDYNAADFGYWVVSSIGDRVWAGTNGDGVQDPGEVGLGGVTVDLTEAGTDGILGTADDIAYPAQITTGAGAYLFANLAPGLYRVDVDDTTLPAGFVTTTNNDPLDVTLNAGQAVDIADFGYWDPASIGDRVWNDLNGDGVQDAGEPGLVGVTVNLVEAGPDGTLGTADDVTLSPVVTGVNGSYAFNDLPAGTYEIRVDSASVPAGFSASTLNPLQVVLSNGEDRTDVDFGFWLSAAVGDRVWADLDGDGAQDAGEPGLVGVTVALTEAGPDATFGTGDDVAHPSQVTAANGAYDFTGLPPGLYRVDVVNASVPAGMVLTTANDPTTVTLTPGDDVNTVDFGYRHSGVIGDLIWNDLNGNGVPDPGEPGLGSVTVLYGGAGPDGVCGTADDQPIGSVQTNASGVYSIPNLPADTYCIVVDGTTVPAGLVPTTGAGTQTVVLTPGQVDNTVDFAYRQTAAIGDRVWHDLDRDGVQDAGELGLSGVVVQMVGAGPDGLFGTADDVSFPNETTAADGSYLFSNLLPGNYRVTVDGTTVPNGMVLTTANLPHDVTLTPGGGGYALADFGYQFDGSIGDRVWHDTGANGTQDGGEAGLNGITVTLLEAGPDTTFGTGDDVTFPSQTTSGDGNYLFEDLAPGLYRIDVDDTTVPAGMVLTTANDPTTVSLSASQNVTNVDFGYDYNGTVGDRIWNDVDGDTTQDPGEPGINGVTVTLNEAGPDGVLGTGDDVSYGSQVTAGDGAYLFQGLPPGLYRVDVTNSTVPAGLQLTTANDPLDLTLAASANDLTADFGYLDSGSIGDRVWHDVDEDGVQDPGEPGLDGITLTLVGAGPDGVLGTGDDVSFPPQATAGGGQYTFPGLPPGPYRVTVDPSTVPNGMQLTTANQPLDVTLAPTQDLLTADFGYRDTGSIGDLVWEDTNENGVQDPGEPPLAGVTVALREAGPDGVFGTSDDVVFPPQATAADGTYGFDFLPPGTYRASVDDATLPVPMTLASGTDPHPVTLGPGQVYDAADFGYVAVPIVIGDVIWIDSDGDNRYEPDVGERPVPDVLVHLYDTSTGERVASARTNASGEYRFYVRGGTYRVEVDPSNFAPGGPLEGAWSTGAGTQTTATVTQDRFDLDFGFAVVAPGGRQYCDWWTVNTSAWPLQTIMVAHQSRSQQEALDILSTGNQLLASYYSGRAGARASVRPDVSVQLAWALIGAKLNVAAGNSSGDIEATLRQADAWLAGVGIGSGITPGHAQHATGMAYYNAINAWNQG